MKKSHSRDKKKSGSDSFSDQKKSIRRPSVDEFPMRLNKYLAHGGVASRRKCAELIKAGHVKVNGTIENNPAVLIKLSDNVTYKGKRIRVENRKVYILLNKPKDYITTVSDERDRRTVIDLIKGVKERIYPVGRLDRNTTGLILLTNDGDLAQKLSHPSQEVKKVYEATLFKKASEQDLEKIRNGLKLEDGVAEVDWVNFKSEEDHRTIVLELHQGKNRIVRRIFEHLGNEVKSLDRVYYAGLSKKICQKAGIDS